MPKVDLRKALSELSAERYVKAYGYQSCVNIGMVGHVDHGKTMIVESITGVWTSAHSEELRRGITIKVGYADAAFYRCRSCPAPECYTTEPTCPRCKGEGELLRIVSFVDCPGHESLMANMLSGASLMDGSILVIAANERVPQPQTREHLMALQMLGMKQIVIAQNKLDLVGEEEALESYESIRAFVAGSLADGAPIIPISAQHGLNIDALVEAVEGCIATPVRDPKAPPLMQVLRSFDVNRPGIKVANLKGGVVGGTLLQGRLKLGDEVELRPGIMNEATSKYEPLCTRVTSLGTSAGLVEEVKPGGLVAVGTKIDPLLTKGDALIGSVLGGPGGGPPVYEKISTEAHLFETAVGSSGLVKVEKIRAGEALRLNIGTAVTLGVVSSVKDGFVEVKLKRPVCALARSRVAISRRIADRWRLIGFGLLE